MPARRIPACHRVADGGDARTALRIVRVHHGHARAAGMTDPVSTGGRARRAARTHTPGPGPHALGRRRAQRMRCRHSARGCCTHACMHRARFPAAALGFLSTRARRLLPHRMHVVNKTLLSCAIGATLLACPLFAQADDDRFTLRLGAMQAEAESRFSADAEFGGQAYAFESGRYTLGDRTVPRAEGIFRIGNRHRLLFNYFRYAQDRDYALGQDLVLGDTTIPAGTTARFDTEFDLGGLVYDFAV